MSFESLPSPALLLDRRKMAANIGRMNAALSGSGVNLRPHVKTSKSPEIVREMTRGWSGAVTVSTLKEAEQVFAAGFRDILYAVGIAPARLPQAAALTRAGARVSIILDSVEAADAVGTYASAEGIRLPVLIEIDSDGHRAGVMPGDGERLLAIGQRLAAGGAELMGVMTHGGGSYDTPGAEALRAHAEREKSGAVQAARVLREAGLPCPVVSVGSTPTALFASGFEGVTEVRAGVYVFFDLVMAGLGVCDETDIALSVLTRVIGHQHERGWVIVDAGWMALSRDRGAGWQDGANGYGRVCDEDGRLIDGLVVSAANQEHGIVSAPAGAALDARRLPIGTLLRILPNHACATAAQHDAYHLVENGRVTGEAPRFRGW